MESAVTGSRIELSAPLSFWGGYDPQTGTITDPAHPQFGEVLTGRIVVLERTSGSTSAPGALLESLRLGTGPAGFELSEPDAVVIVATELARSLYGIDVPVTIVRPVDRDRERSGR
jgi:predicted aconitase with swiveling domain